MGYSRDSFYRYKELYETGGEAALQNLSRKQPNRKNRVPQHVEEAVVSIAIKYPAYGQLRASNELQKQGILVSPAGIRNISMRNDIETFKKRLLALEAKVVQEGIILSEEQVQALERSRVEREAHGQIETEHPGYLGSLDTYYIGTIKGIGRMYQQTFIDTYSRIAIAKIYTEKTAITAADMLNDRVLPWFNAQSVPLLRILTDRGTEYCGKVENHAFQLYLALENIDHSRTKARHPQTNGIVERLNRTIEQEFYDIAFRKRVYTSIEGLQKDLDEWLNNYNNLRPHSGRFCYGKTPMQTFIDSKHLAQEQVLDSLLETSDTLT